MSIRLSVGVSVNWCVDCLVVMMNIITSFTANNLASLKIQIYIVSSMEKLKLERSHGVVATETTIEIDDQSKIALAI